MNKLKYVTLICVGLLTMTSSVYADETKTSSSVDISLDATVKDDKEVSDVLDSLEKELKDVSTVNVEYASKVQEHVELSEKIVTKTNEKSELQKTSKNLDAELEKLKAEVAQLEQAKADRAAEAKRKEQEAKLKEQEAKREESQSQAQAPVGSASYGSGQERAAFEKISAELGLSEADKAIWADIITKESGWSTTATNPGSGAYGLGQALPAGKMAPYGSDYQTNPYTQLKWMYDYIVGRYGSMQGVGAFWASHHWY